jgi:hypothetical protein
MPDAMPDNDINSFLSHEVNPVVGRVREERAVPLCPQRGAGRKFP